MTVRQILQQFWGYTSFRPLQEEIVNTVLERQDALVLMPTGGGKSICFQVPTLAMKGVCIVVTPLIALMKDQVEQLRKRGIPASAIYSGMHYREIDTALDNCIYGNTKFLYVSPERLRTEIVIERVKQMTVCLLAVDEAHCISAWGYDFRPPYLQIAEFRELIPDTPVIALTASATPDVQADIQEKLVLHGPDGGPPAVFRQTFARPNLSYSAVLEESKESRLFKILQNVPGCGIVYVRSRRQTQQIAQTLYRQGISADFYHAGLSTQQRAEKQDAWIQNRTRVMVATNAFGMGIDKPDVRVVVHLDVPDSLEAYYQEAGRAGRDGQKAYAVMLYTRNDLENLRYRTEQLYQPVDMLRRVYQALANYTAVPVGGGQFSSYDFDLHTFTHTFNLPAQETHYALKQLQLEGLIQLNENYFHPSRMIMVLDNRQLYEFQVLNSRFDSFLKLILRMYGGEVFTDFITISESALARAYLVNQDEVVTLLEQLHQRNVLVYEKQKDKPQLTFLTPRFDAPTLPVNTQELNRRKELALRKVQAATIYVEHPTQCRTRLLQAYFGEKPGEACGICDNCIKKRKSHEVGASVVRKQVREYVAMANGPGISPKQLAHYFSQADADALAQTLKQMLAEEEIRYTKSGNLTLNQ
ncbi:MULTISPECIES: RecQ family ATP-dependent DNA helicase [Spirosoma]|uniref:ATP-dependent DNA helicase RecQ n=1 Tax=Spirosoma liriopis TaxID=2937440 RepID=A0ABT0HIF8_9BACT|nr:ATP-dependent DNA helicase RecQ [Spirosoma oryzicola]MCK8491944.1 RecQ family ATP-dependent DNA helicase [Spirosoma liriopis]UHG91265.1 RecQ family ATP-dependent DNA helicase [Spirosoma oryzicola]